MASLFVQRQCVGRIWTCSERFQCVRFKKTVKAKMGVSTVTESIWQHGAQLHCVISSFGVLPAVILTFVLCAERGQQ